MSGHGGQPPSQPQQQFCLRWNNHQPNFVSVFASLLQSESLVDVTLTAEGRQIQAHKVVLSACSTYFQRLFSETQQCQGHPIVILKDVRYDELRLVVDFIYNGQVNIGQDQLPSVLKIAESLSIKGLAEVPGDGDVPPPTNNNNSYESPIRRRPINSNSGGWSRKSYRDDVDSDGPMPLLIPAVGASMSASPPKRPASAVALISAHEFNNGSPGDGAATLGRGSPLRSWEALAASQQQESPPLRSGSPAGGGGSSRKRKKAGDWRGEIDDNRDFLGGGNSNAAANLIVSSSLMAHNNNFHATKSIAMTMNDSLAAKNSRNADAEHSNNKRGGGSSQKQRNNTALSIGSLQYSSNFAARFPPDGVSVSEALELTLSAAAAAAAQSHKTLNSPSRTSGKSGSSSSPVVNADTLSGLLKIHPLIPMLDAGNMFGGGNLPLSLSPMIRFDQAAGTGGDAEAATPGGGGQQQQHLQVPLHLEKSCPASLKAASASGRSGGGSGSQPVAPCALVPAEDGAGGGSKLYIYGREVTGNMLSALRAVWSNQMKLSRAAISYRVSISTLWRYVGILGNWLNHTDLMAFFDQQSDGAGGSGGGGAGSAAASAGDGHFMAGAAQQQQLPLAIAANAKEKPEADDNDGASEMNEDDDDDDGGEDGVAEDLSVKREIVDVNSEEETHAGERSIPNSDTAVALATVIDETD